MKKNPPGFAVLTGSQPKITTMNSASRAPNVKGCIPSRPSGPFDLNRAILASGLTHGAKVLLLVIADHARHGRSKCTASTATLARESGMTARHVQRLIQVLEDAGWIQIERATGSRRSRHTIFLAPREGFEPGPRLHEVGHFGACGRTFPVHEVGPPCPTKGVLRAPEETTTDQPESSSSLLSLEPGTPESIEPVTCPDQRRVEPSAVDAALLAILTARVAILFAWTVEKAGAVIRKATQAFPLAWIGVALDAAEKFRPKAKQWSWGVVLGILKNFEAEGGPSGPSPEISASLPPAEDDLWRSPGVTSCGQNYNPPSPPSPELRPTEAQLEDTIRRARGTGPDARPMRGLVRKWIKLGWVDADVVPPGVLDGPGSGPATGR
jgi:hypothetical protein